MYFKDHFLSESERNGYSSLKREQYCIGVMPVSFLKAAEKALCDEKPSDAVISEIGKSEKIRMFCAVVIRAFRMKAFRGIFISLAKSLER